MTELNEGTFSRLPSNVATPPYDRTRLKRGIAQPAGSCTASAAAHPQMPRPSTPLTNRPGNTPVTRNEVCMKPGMLHSCARKIEARASCN
jgi:hypothetical protein